MILYIFVSKEYEYNLHNTHMLLLYVQGNSFINLIISFTNQVTYINFDSVCDVKLHYYSQFILLTLICLTYNITKQKYILNTSTKLIRKAN